MRQATVKVRIAGTQVYVDQIPPTSMSDPAQGPARPAEPYRAASTGRRMGGYRPTGAGPNAVVAASAPELVRRTRDQIRNTGHARRAVNLYGTHIIGTGIVPRPKCRDKGLRRAIRELWDAWVDVADADGAYDFYGLQWQAVLEMVSGGDAFGRMRPRLLSDGLPVPLQVQLLPTEMLPLSFSRIAGTNEVMQGIERDGIGRRVGYWFYPRHPGDLSVSIKASSLEPVRVRGEDVCHLRNAPAGQLRGLPWLAVGLAFLKQASDWQDASLLRRQLLAAVVGFVRTVLKNEMTYDELEEAWGKIEEQYGELPAVTMEPGTMQYLKPGEDVEFPTFQDTGATDEIFLRTTMQSVAASFDLIYEELTGDWKNANDRTFRACFNTFKRTVRQWQHHLVCFQWNRPIYNRFLEIAVNSGVLTVPRTTSENDLRRVLWVPERWEYLNPKQDAEAMVLEIDNKITARDAVITSRGDDPDEVDEEIAAGQQRESRLGIATPPRRQPPSAQQPEQQDQGL